MSNYTSNQQDLAPPSSPLSPFSPSLSPSPLASPDAPPPRSSIPRIRSNASHLRRNSLLPTTTLSFKDQLLNNAKHLQRKALSLWASATPIQRAIFVVAYVTITTLSILFLIYSHRIFDALAPIAVKWRALPGGWLIIFAAIFVTAFPPIIGYSTALTIAGFVYGMKGWFICAAANVCGSLASLIVSRTLLASYVHRLVGEDKRFTAFALTLKHDGVKILIMIRLCPLPYSLSNAALSTFPTVHPLAFAVATAAATPKLLIHVFIGSRLAAIAEAGGKMDTATKVINYASIIGFSILGAAVGYIIYQRTVERARQIEAEENQVLVETPGYPRERDGYFEDGDAGEHEGLTGTGAEGFGDDDISLWDNDATDGGYRDDWTDEETGGGEGGLALLDEEADIEWVTGSRRLNRAPQV